jgi:hypothetical protein
LPMDLVVLCFDVALCFTIVMCFTTLCLITLLWFTIPLCFATPLPKYLLPLVVSLLFCAFLFLYVTLLLCPNQYSPLFLFYNVLEIQYSTLEFGMKLGSTKYQVGGSNKFFILPLFFWNYFLLFLFNVCFRFFSLIYIFLFKKIIFFGYFLRISRKSLGIFLFFLKYFCYDISEISCNYL